MADKERVRQKVAKALESIRKKEQRPGLPDGMSEEGVRTSYITWGVGIMGVFVGWWMGNAGHGRLEISIMWSLPAVGLMLFIRGHFPGWFRMVRPLFVWVATTLVSLVSGIAMWCMLSPTPIEILVVPQLGKHAAGSVVGGILWKDNYYDLGIALFNRGEEEDYEAVDLTITTNSRIVDCSPMNKAALGVDCSPPRVAIQEKNGIIIGLAQIATVGTDGSLVDIPPESEGSNQCRIHCQRLSHADSVQLVLATDSGIPSHVWVSGSYDTPHSHMTIDRPLEIPKQPKRPTGH
jgi:hypothetical protein